MRPSAASCVSSPGRTRKAGSGTADIRIKPNDRVCDIANAFFRAGLIEAWGRGYEKIREACREAGAPEPTVAMDGGLRVEWQWQVPEDTAHPVARPRTQGGAGQVTGQVAGQVTGQVTGQVAGQVDRLLMELSAGERKREELQAALGLAGRGDFRALYLNPALDAGLVEMTIPDKPNSRLQRYRLTDAGRAKLAAKRGGRR